MSVVHVVLALNIGGLEKVVYDLVRFADRDEFATSVLCLGEIGALEPAFQEIGIPVEALGVHKRGILRGIMAVARRLRELRPDVLHTHNPAAHIVGAPAARWAGIPVVVHSRHGMHESHGWSTTLGNRLATRLTHCMVAVSTAAATISRSDDRGPENRLAVIRNGVDLNLYRQRGKSAPHTSFKAIHAARLDNTTKDQRTLLRAVRLVVDRKPDFTLDIVGDGSDRTTLEALCDELKLRSHVQFLGFRHDVHELLPQADLFVLSSVTEGLPMTLLEAMAAGLPIVSTDVGGISELVRHQETGLLVAPQNPEALACAILELVHDPQRSVDMGRAGRRRVEQEFDIRVVTARYEELYRTLLRKNRR
ncbi:MAG: GT4 family glycosyltransferase PelF [Planctomycetia bacterium]|nr:GT4 family glycosyltransferase PelF [Planctomycetia bacterium]